MATIQNPYLLFLGDAADQLAAKTANGVKVWRPEWCVGQVRLPGCKADLGLDDLTIAQGAERGAKTVILGVANRGGFIPDSWIVELVKALDLGMDIASGLHTKITQIPALVDAAERNGRQLFDVRHPTRDFAIANGKPRAGKRLLTVGTDVSVGKMFTTLAVEKEMRARGLNADFRATGQTGIFIAGSGASIDAVIADFISGCVEWLAPENTPDHWDLIEGQGSLYNVSYSGVTLGLIHGSQADALVMCHEIGRPHLRGLPDYPVPEIPAAMETILHMARMVNRDVKFVGVSLNTSNVSADEATAFKAKTAAQTGLPVVDPLKDGVAPIVDRLMAG
ncbi:MAG: DUF1611 domain-containing protein [Alphaproteobacteria bacterium]|nr:DUF1611 domain-containing protein [Alphaproteobacteria bacterium]